MPSLARRSAPAPTSAAVVRGRALAAGLQRDRVRGRRTAAASRSTDRYQSAILERYKLCVETADRVGPRRNLTNTFFLTLNTAVVAALATASPANWRGGPVWLLPAGLITLLTQCLACFVMTRSHRRLNATKYAVIGALERRLPALAYSEAEWGARGAGRNWRRHVPLTYVEQGVPLIFGAAYTAGFPAAVRWAPGPRGIGRARRRPPRVRNRNGRGEPCAAPSRRGRTARPKGR
ncbi:hypothetical protein [Streptomyces sp. NPDC003077]|uniref:RipA family octameric membrane protein n=1 Tax=Streptomyces sp. NPDC003077 TaxID=3154443 RepID=UPI0033A22536